MSTVGPVLLEGWTEAVRALRQVSSQVSRELTRELRDGARIVQVKAKSNAASRGLAPPGRSGRGTGGLVGGLRVFATQSTAGVRDTATRNGYGYPARYEFQNGGARAFLFPAGEETAGEVEQHIDGMFDRLRSEAGLGRGGAL